MSLASGTRLGRYQIADQIGVGGMGEVYRATDVDLKRAVAIKVLPAPVAADAERLARFQREAEVLASLNHPNIAAIYGLERSDGTTALVMELPGGCSQS
jgi:serine/threonine protein kinase